MESSSPGPQSPAKLERIGRYRIVRPLSKGGMALVYEARRESLAGVSPRVAIKLILPEYVNSDTFQELFINEARLGASMQHQNLVQIQDFDRDGERFFLVMEYVEGLTIRRAISLCKRHEVQIPLGVIAEMGRQACDGLHYAHSAHDEHGHHLRLVHRDVKPSNLILNSQGVVKVLDFGISKGRLLRERKGAVKGTWGYMAPEQAMGQEVGPQADVFGVATVLYEMAARQVLFEGKDKSGIKRLLMDDHAARMAATIDPGNYGPLVPVLVRALQRDPAARYGAAVDLGRALSALLPDPITARDEVERFFKMVTALQDGMPVEAAMRSASFHSSAPAPTHPSQGSMVGTGLTTSGVGFTALGLLSLGVAMVLTAAAVAAVGLLVTGLLSSASVDEERRVADVLGADTPTYAADEPAGPAGEGAPGELEPPPGAQRHAESDAPTEIPVRTVAEARPPPAATVPVPASEPVPDAVADAPPEPERRVIIRKIAQAPEPVEVAPPPASEPSPVSTEPGLLTIGAKQDAEVYVDGQFLRRVPLVKREIPVGTHVITIQALDGRKKTFELEVGPGQEIRKVWDFDRGDWR